MADAEKTPDIAVVGLGYVGLPLAVALARHGAVLGFDVNAERIAALQRGVDSTGEVTAEALAAATLSYSADPQALAGIPVYIVAVPTPVDAAKRPDLGAVLHACELVGTAMRRGATIVFESTVYPGVTEDVCGPALAKASGLVCGREFFLGYSPERMNPGDPDHAVNRIPKVVAGQTPDVTDRLAALYGRVTGDRIFRARDIKTAEAAKVIENAQRDINIAFINEVTKICNAMGLSVYDVIEAAATKWNFLPFTPGLVGGHCIGVDPYYLAHCAMQVGHRPEVVLAGRRTNDSMGHYVAEQIDRALASKAPAQLLVLGLTFKENVPDLRNTRVIDLVEGLSVAGHDVRVHDPLADPAEAKATYGIDLLETLDGPYDGVVGAVPHRAYREMHASDLAALLRPGGLLCDVKGMWRAVTLPDGYRRWQL